MDLELRGKRAVISGGTGGIGRAVAIKLATEGADVALLARDQERLDATTRSISDLIGRAVLGVSADTGSRTAVESAMAPIAESLGGIDILVNAAARRGGRSPAPRWNEITDQALVEEIQIKVLGYLHMAQAVVPFMQQAGWGRIINVAGLGARHTGSIIGSIRNVAVSALSKNLADELCKFGINVVTVHPGTTRTEDRNESSGPWGGNVVGRMIEAAEVANVIAFLASPTSVAITGDSIPVGGGEPKAIYY
jgi:NAD(P)-dependent dehydrogenase (short-subunit alcohol dehydrogenase family)